LSFSATPTLAQVLASNPTKFPPTSGTIAIDPSTLMAGPDGGVRTIR
jgi:hypothetical protein